MNPVIFIPMPISELVQIIRQEMKLLYEIEKPKLPNSLTDQWFDINEFCHYHPDKPSKYTVYGWLKAGRFTSHKTGKKHSFLKSEVDQEIRKGKKIESNGDEIDRITASLQIGKRKKLVTAVTPTAA